RLQYRDGAVPFLEVDRAESMLLSSQVVEAELHMQTALAAVGLYRALGGGWQTMMATTEQRMIGNHAHESQIEHQE
ncbi:MAG: hypothetical protein M3036_16920, partial [Bifidobacteriales bacterium]|nr:hypothetical protein [Bifidobacteriales bacterium]